MMNSNRAAKVFLNPAFDNLVWQGFSPAALRVIENDALKVAKQQNQSGADTIGKPLLPSEIAAMVRDAVIKTSNQVLKDHPEGVRGACAEALKTIEALNDAQVGNLREDMIKRVRAESDKLDRMVAVDADPGLLSGNLSKAEFDLAYTRQQKRMADIAEQEINFMATAEECLATCEVKFPGNKECQKALLEIIERVAAKHGLRTTMEERAQRNREVTKFKGAAVTSASPLMQRIRGAFGLPAKQSARRASAPR